MSDVRSQLDELVKKTSVFYVAEKLGHSDTAKLKRWLREGVPSIQEGPVRVILDMISKESGL